MADIDTSILAFCEKIHSEGFNVCISGECSDEIFGGYPWYYRKDLVEHIGFPWALSEDLRSKILKPNLLKDNELNDYVENARINTLKNVKYLNIKDTLENKFRDTNYLTIKWFMNTLIERTDRMSTANFLEVRVPFANYKLFEYVYNLPARMKLGISNYSLPTEKYLLRKAFTNDLPEDVLYRKKSPFPKTYDPIYLSMVENKLKEILKDKNSRLGEIIDLNFVKKMLDIHGENLTQNWFGQLMTYPQTLAYLIQINYWLINYNISIEL